MKYNISYISMHIVPLFHFKLHTDKKSTQLPVIEHHLRSERSRDEWVDQPAQGTTVDQVVETVHGKLVAFRNALSNYKW